MLPRAVLCTSPRRGASHRTQVAEFTRRRCQRWLDGERRELWEDLASHGRGRRRAAARESTANSRHRRCRRLAAEGEYAGACAALTDPPMLERDAAVEAELRSKHPLSAPPRLAALGAPSVAAVPEFSAELVTYAVRGFRRGSAPGPTGLRPDHLREALGTAHSDEVAAHLATLCQLLARGEAPEALAVHFAGARLHALPKKGGGVRPVAVGETLRRLVAKLLCEQVRDDARSLLWPLQVGVAAPGGAEVAVHAARQWAQRNAGNRSKVLVKVDFENAFNTVDREALLRDPGPAEGLTPPRLTPPRHHEAPDSTPVLRLLLPDLNSWNI